MQETNAKRKVILNNVFPNAGYMTTYDNIGHETVNLFKADEGYFIHLNAYGTYNKQYDYLDVLNLAYVSDGLYKVISKAVDCCVFDGASISGKDPEKRKKRFDKQKDAIHYDDIPVYKFFEKNRTMKGLEEKDLFVTFEAKGIYEPKQNIYVAFKNCKSLNDSNNIYRLKDKIKFSSACRIEKLSRNDQDVLFGMIDNNDIWQEEPIKSLNGKIVALNSNKNNEENYFTFLGVEKQELQYSNALVKILKFNPDFLSDFLSKLSGEDCKNNKFEILREEKSIDLLFRDLDKKNGKIFVIENKIDANVTLSEEKMKVEEQVEKWIKKMENITDEEWSQDQLDIKNKILSRIVNKKDNLTSQLSKYYVIAVYWALKNGWDDKKISKDVHCYLLCPEYHKYNYKVNNEGFLDSDFALSGMYKLITYEKIKEIFDNFSKDNLSDHQRFLFDDFISAISALAKARDDSMELKMIKMFIDRYNEIKVEQHK